MIDISTIAPKIVHYPSLPRPSVPILRVGASLAAISALLGDVFNMAYVAPYTNQRRPRQAVAEDDLNGRDPAW